MQFSQSQNRQQRPLFEAFLEHAYEPEPSHYQPTCEAFSELRLLGSLQSCKHLLRPILREISQSQDPRWLTLIAPDANLSTSWLRSLDLDLNRLLLLHPSHNQNAFDLACHALRLGRSHTVISWIDLNTAQRKTLSESATQGRAHSLNIFLQ